MSKITSNLIKLLPLVIVASVVAVILFMFWSKPEPRKRTMQEKPVIVEVQELQAQPFQVYIESYGNIEAKTSGNLVAQVSGLITEVSDNFASGKSFKKGDVLAHIDDKDYKIEVTIAQAELANAQLTLQQEEALAEQAKRDWEKINPNKKASGLVLRQPQVASAKAKLDAARARLDKAKLALERTKVTAPYDGKIIAKLADVGQLINQNTPVAHIFASDTLEVRLPVAANKVQFLPDFTESNKVELSADFGGFSKNWPAKLVRTDSVIDQSSRQWFVTANIGGELLEQDALLKIGQFVNAKIYGLKLADALVVPSQWVYDNQYVYLYNQGKLERRQVTIQWQEDELSLIAAGLKPGEQVITTPVRFVAEGAKLQIKGQVEAKPNRKNRKSGVAQ
ncbi:MAG: efflux RND transporter periplasmic adaptor subunit [Gammaproteobacteria bacterium]|nr:efflux RND transporter periplasmic adaptor subunit [Gammaproteobacteria bacterium]